MQGQLGHDNTDDYLQPTLIVANRFENAKVQMVACGDGHTAAVTSSGKLWTFGTGDNGQLGLGITKKSLVPLLVDPESFKHAHVVMVACGFSHTAAVAKISGGLGKRCNTLWTWGCGIQGRLGHGADCADKMVPTEIPTARFADCNMCTVACGDDHTAAVTQNGRVFTWGVGNNWQLGHSHREACFVPTRIERLEQHRVVTVACGPAHTAAVTEEGHLWTWGNGSLGQVQNICVRTMSLLCEHVRGARRRRVLGARRRGTPPQSRCVPSGQVKFGSTIWEYSIPTSYSPVFFPYAFGPGARQLRRGAPARSSPSTLPRATRSFEIWPSDTIFPLFLGPGIFIATNLCCLPSNCPGKSCKPSEQNRFVHT